ncbi:MAG: hypothetical protein H0U52_13690 [Chloroflexi bacterium]|nr:hypothetical protein [Chloroflexota bacterium]
MDEGLQLSEIEYGYVNMDQRIVVRAIPAEVDALVAEIARRGWNVRSRRVDVIDIANARDRLLADLEGR